MVSYSWVLSIKRQRCVPLHAFCCTRGELLGPPNKKGGRTMVTYYELIQIGLQVGLLTVGIIGLVLQLIELDRKHRR